MKEVTLTLADILECSNVHRWHIVPTLRQQNNADHQWRVAILTQYITQDMENLSMRIAAVMYAMHHDIDEVITGDIPGPTKKHTPIEVDVRMPDWMIDYVIPEGVRVLVKVADLIESYIFLTENSIRSKERHTVNKLYERVMSILRVASIDGAQRERINEVLNHVLDASLSKEEL